MVTVFVLEHTCEEDGLCVCGPLSGALLVDPPPVLILRWTFSQRKAEPGRTLVTSCLCSQHSGLRRAGWNPQDFALLLADQGHDLIANARQSSSLDDPCNRGRPQVRGQ